MDRPAQRLRLEPDLQSEAEQHRADEALRSLSIESSDQIITGTRQRGRGLEREGELETHGVSPGRPRVQAEGRRASVVRAAARGSDVTIRGIAEQSDGAMEPTPSRP